MFGLYLPEYYLLVYYGLFSRVNAQYILYIVEEIAKSKF